MLLQGDELSVQLFIGAAALTALSVAMTQAGWTHKWFVRGMFALAALLSVSSIGWPLIQTRIPAINDALQAAASSRIGWFFVGIIPAFVGGMLLSDLLRRRREITRLPSKWLPIFKAMETLARQDLLDRYQYVGKQISDILDERLPLERRLTELETPGPIVSALERSEIAQEYARLSAQRDATRKNRRNGFRPPKIVAKLCDQILRLNCAKGICSQRDFWLRIDREL